MDSAIAEATGSMVNSIHVPNNKYFGMMRGIVIKNDDTEFQRGRCKVYVPGVYPEKFKENDGELLPWCEPCQPLFCGGGGDLHKNGTFQYPDVGSTVWLFFENNDITRPVMFGQTTDSEGKFDNNICKVYWEGMYIEMDKTTHTITASATNITAIAEKELNGYAETINLTAVTANLTSTTTNMIADTTNVTSNNVTNVTSPNINMYGDTLIKGTVHITGATTIDSNLTVNASEVVAVDSVIGGKSFIGHMHTGNVGAPTSPPL